jgi:hypothetical protein
VTVPGGTAPHTRGHRASPGQPGPDQGQSPGGRYGLIDLGFFRPGGEEHAEENGTFGLATIRKDHGPLAKGQLVFEYPAKGAKQREQAVAEDRVCTVVRSLLLRRGGGDQLLAYRTGQGWHDVTAADINDYLREISEGDYTAKDFRTWHATVLAAVGHQGPRGSRRGEAPGPRRLRSAAPGGMTADRLPGQLATACGPGRPWSALASRRRRPRRRSASPPPGSAARPGRARRR